eukprot:c5270_g1_i1.p1 GENE.c5270_g1_i1~~c5270_g1_i1.p1  ORF type:complete len:335 (-),score=62.13 c5270_g1_i1:177-1091(-)
MSKANKDSVWQTLPPITAGALATATVMYPADLVRALKMSAAAEQPLPITALLKNFYNTHGAKGFVTQGVGPEMARATYMRVLKFFLFPICHRAIYGKNPSEGTWVTKGIAAAACSLPEGFTIAPLEVAKIGLQLDKEKRFNNNSFNVLRHVMKTRGWTGLFLGYTGMQYRQTSWTAVYFASLSFWEQQSKLVIPKEWKATQQLSGGFAAGMFGAVFNTPGDVIRSTLQKKYLSEVAPAKQSFSVGLCVDGFKEFFTVGATIASTRGVSALWAGFPFKAVHLGGSGALLALFMPFFKKLMGVNVE